MTIKQSNFKMHEAKLAKQNKQSSLQLLLAISVSSFNDKAMNNLRANGHFLKLYKTTAEQTPFLSACRDSTRPYDDD